MIENVKFKNVNIVNFSNIIPMLLFLIGIIICSQITIPLPTGVPITLQTFSIALMGFSLGYKKGSLVILSYILLGICGLPVFSSFSNGLSTVLGVTGGFIIGFIPMVILCGLSNNIRNKFGKILLIILSLSMCHIFGIVQYSILMNINITTSFLLVSAPFLIKDLISIFLAFFSSKKLYF